MLWNKQILIIQNIFEYCNKYHNFKGIFNRILYHLSCDGGSFTVPVSLKNQTSPDHLIISNVVYGSWNILRCVQRTRLFLKGKYDVCIYGWVVENENECSIKSHMKKLYEELYESSRTHVHMSDNDNTKKLFETESTRNN